MPGPQDDVERLIVACVERQLSSSPEAPARAILESLWEAGYEVTRRPDVIQIRRHPGEDRANG